MPAYDGDAIVRTLAGRWRLRATNYWFWKDPSICSIDFEYAALPGAVPALGSDVRYERRGRMHHQRGVSRFRPSTGGFMWRGRGLGAMLAVDWLLAAANEEGTIVLLRFSGLMLIPSNLHVLVRADVDVSTDLLRGEVGRAMDRYGIDGIERSRLSWVG